jgi:hypothetical protein
MAEFVEVPIAREDGSDSLFYVTISMLSYADSQLEQDGEGRTLTVHLADGYWFTLSGPGAAAMAALLRNRSNSCLKGDVREN